MQKEHQVAIPVVRNRLSKKIGYLMEAFSLLNNIFCGILQQIHQCCEKCKKESRNTDSTAALPSEWQPCRPADNGFNQEYEDMSLIRTFTDIRRKTT